MTPIYFPFSCMHQSIAEMLKTCFPKIALYLPSGSGIADQVQMLADDGFLELHTPVKEEEQKLEAIVREYHEWARLHQGRDLSFFKTRQGSVPFYDEFSVQQIRSDIRQKESRKAVKEEVADPLLQARIFLRISQEYDIRQWELGNELESMTGLEKNLMSQLRGGEEDDDGPEIGPKIAKDDSGRHMTGERLSAWARLLLSDPPSSNLFLTSSRAVLDMVTDRIPEAEEVLEVQGISLQTDAVPQWQEALAECLEKISGAGEIEEKEILRASEDEEYAFSMIFYRIPGTDSKEFLHRIMDPAAGAGEKAGSAGNVLIGWVGENYEL